MNDYLEHIAECIYDAHIALAIEQRRPSRFIESAGLIDGEDAFESVKYVNLSTADKATFFELAQATLLGWEKRV